MTQLETFKYLKVSSAVPKLTFMSRQPTIPIVHVQFVLNLVPVPAGVQCCSLVLFVFEADDVHHLHE